MEIRIVISRTTMSVQQIYRYSLIMQKTKMLMSNLAIGTCTTACANERPKLGDFFSVPLVRVAQ